MSPGVIIVLVHGTRPRVLGRELFAPPSWTRHGSPFQTRLAATLTDETLFDEFIWDGANTHAARLSAGERLAERLRQLRREHPLARLVVVAHSHGGNVAMYAMRHLETASPAAPQIVDDLVCLGTPFFRVALRDLDVVLWRFWVSVYYGIFLGVAASFFALVPLAAVISITLARALIIVIAAVFIGWLFLGRRLMKRWMTSGRVAAIAPRARELARRVDSTPPVYGPKLLIVKSARDEAKLWLTLADRTAALVSGEGLLRVTSHALFKAVDAIDWLQERRRSVLAAAAGVLGLILNLIGSVGWKPVQLKGMILSPLMLIVAMAIVHAIVFAVTALTVRGSSVTFGQSLFLSLVATVTATDRPPSGGASAYDELPVTLPRGIFHHSAFYVDPPTMDRVAAWIAARSPAGRAG